MPNQKGHCDIRGQNRRDFWSLIAVACLICVYGVLAYTSTLGKNANIDEPTHAMGAYMVRWHGDYREDASNPPLWARWIGLGLPRNIIKVDLNTPDWPALLRAFGDSPRWFVPILYHTPGNDPDRFFDRGRRMMLLYSLGLAAVTAWWAWRLAGPLAAIVATCCFVFNPNLLAYGAIIKNDIAATLCWTGACIAMWKLGQRITLLRIAVLGLLCGAAIMTKLTGILLLPVVALLLLLRVYLLSPWSSFQLSLKSRRAKLLACCSIFIFVLLLCWIITWASYGFRFGPNPDPSQRFDLTTLAQSATRARILANDPNQSPTTEQVAAEQADLLTRTALWADSKHLAPESFLAGVIYVDGYNRFRPAFLMGMWRTTGWWYYFPVAALFKTPVSSLVAAALAAGVLIAGQFGKNRLSKNRDGAIDHWAAWCLLLPMVIFGIAIMRSAQNVGVRHAFTMAPPIFVLIGIAAARAYEMRPKLAIGVMGLLTLGTILESSLAFPDYLSYFNFAAGGERGGIRWLADSNLDSGQDLKAFAAWRQAHPEGQLELDYLGTADPTYYLHEDFITLEKAVSTDPLWAWRPGYLAISATHLQGLYVPAQVARFFGQLRRLPPVAVIGGSIYVYRLPLMENHQPGT